MGSPVQVDRVRHLITSTLGWEEMPSRANLSHSPINRVTSRQSRSRPATPMASCMKRRKHPWNCAGSSSRNTRLNVSWLGTPWRSRRSCRRNAALARPNTAMSEQSSPPHNMVQKPITGISCRSCGVLTSRGTLQRGKAGRKPLHGTPTQQNSMVRLDTMLRRNPPHPDKCQMPFPYRPHMVPRPTIGSSPVAMAYTASGDQGG
jgi:hypothetical protein